MNKQDIKKMGEAWNSVVNPTVEVLEEGTELFQVNIKGEGGATVRARSEKEAIAKVFKKMRIANRFTNDKKFMSGVKVVPAESVEEGAMCESCGKAHEGKCNPADLEEAKKLDPVDDKANDKKFKDRKDKDIDNDGDVDSSDEYLHKRRAATDDAIDGGKKPAKNAKKEEEVEDDEGEEKEAPKVAGKKDDKKKVASNAKTAEISKIGEATEELIGMLESAAKQQKSNATKPEGIMDKESPKSKEFADAHKKSEKKYEDDEEDGHDKTFKAGEATKAKSGKRPQDNASGDNKVVKSTEAPVKEDTTDELVAKAQDIISGKTMSEIAELGQKEKNPHDARTTEARKFLERMAKRRGYVNKD
jgi:hypothetical protein